MSRRILLVLGSFRKNSFNKSLADYIKKSLETEGATVNYLDYKEVPLLEQDTEYPTPASVVKIREEVANSDALWVISPEYNGSYPAVLKNVLDWLSRPVKPFDRETPTVLANKSVTISSAAGSSSGKFVRNNLSTLLSYIRMNVLLEDGVGVQIPQEAWVSGKLELSDEQKSVIDNQVKEFLKNI